VGETGEQLVAVKVLFTEGIEGSTSLVFTAEEARSIVELMLPGMTYTEDDILGGPGLSALREAMNQFVAGIGRALGEERGELVNISTPEVTIQEAGTSEPPTPDPDVVLGWEGAIGPTPGRLYWTMTHQVVEALVPGAFASAVPVAPTPGPTATASPTPVTTPPTTPGARPDLAASASDLGRLADVMLDVTVELGRSRIPIKELLALDEGGVIRLGRPVGEPVDLLVNGLATARGEIVVVDGRLGLRVTELIG
jgi:flagellar motor switch protein FliN/FliY